MTGHDCSDWTDFFTDLNFTDFIFTDLIIHARGLSVTVRSVKIMSDKVYRGCPYTPQHCINSKNRTQI